MSGSRPEVVLEDQVDDSQTSARPQDPEYLGQTRTLRGDRLTTPLLITTSTDLSASGGPPSGLRRTVHSQCRPRCRSRGSRNHVPQKVDADHGARWADGARREDAIDAAADPRSTTSSPGLRSAWRTGCRRRARSSLVSSGRAAISSEVEALGDASISGGHATVEPRERSSGWRSATGGRLPQRGSRSHGCLRTCFRVAEQEFDP